MSAQHSARKRKSHDMEPTTPTKSPVKRLKMSQPDKQALIDNLRLEITERARQLRAHYALQGSDLQARIVRRINRVPVNMRKMKMGELLAQHQSPQPNRNSPPTQALARSPAKPQLLNERPLPTLPSPSKVPSPSRKPQLQSQKSRKRKSSAIQIPSDKENLEPDSSNSSELATTQQNVKRTKTATVAPTQQPKKPNSRAPKKQNPNGVLSPRSHNSRTLPRSPIKDLDKDLQSQTFVREGSPLRQQSPARPASPEKPQSPFKAAMSGISAMAKRGYAAAGAAGARLARPLSREKEQATLSGLGTIIPDDRPTSPAGKMLPPPRPALATLTSTLVHGNSSSSSIPTLSPQRTASQASMRSQTSEQSSASTNGTVITKPKPSRPVGAKRTGVTAKATTAATAGLKKATTVSNSTAVKKAAGKVVVSSSTSSSTSTVSPRTGRAVGRAPTTAAARKIAAASSLKRAGPTTAIATTTGTGRVLRKRN